MKSSTAEEASQAGTAATPLESLTIRQREVYDFLCGFARDRGYPPTTGDIMRGLRIKSPNGVVCNLAALEKKGVIERDPMVSRGLRLIAAPAGVAR